MDLNRSLQLNAVFSFATGLALAAFPALIGDALGVSVDGWLRLLGLALLGHAVFLLWAAQRPKVKTWATLNVIAVAPYPLLMIGLVATGLVERGTGQALILADGAIVGAIAFAQWTGLRSEGSEAHTLAV